MGPFARRIFIPQTKANRAVKNPALVHIELKWLTEPPANI